MIQLPDPLEIKAAELLGWKVVWSYTFAGREHWTVISPDGHKDKQLGIPDYLAAWAFILGGEWWNYRTPAELNAEYEIRHELWLKEREATL